MILDMQEFGMYVTANTRTIRGKDVPSVALRSQLLVSREAELISMRPSPSTTASSCSQ
jgi:hypothetical protein